jgi:sugar phosphate isomerase/epimerase
MRQSTEQWNRKCMATFNADRGQAVVTVESKSYQGNEYFVVRQVWPHAEAQTPFKTLEQAQQYAKGL